MATYGGILKKYSSWRDFEKVDEGRKLSSQLWVRMARYRNYIKYTGRKLNTLIWLRMAEYRKFISSTYVLISSLVSLTNYAGRKLNTLMWLRMAGEFMSIYILWYYLNSQLWLRMAEYRKYLSSTYVFISSFVSLKKYAGQKLNTIMWICVEQAIKLLKIVLSIYEFAVVEFPGRAQIT